MIMEKNGEIKWAETNKKRGRTEKERRGHFHMLKNRKES